MKKARVGIIGAGGIARGVHLPSLSEMDNVELVAICDLFETKTKEMSEKYNIPNTYLSYHDMLANEELDCVFCLVNPDCMYRVARDCMRAGKHVMLEKPAGINAYQAHSLAVEAKNAGVICGVAMNRRTIPLLDVVLEKVREAGPITQIDGRFMKFGHVETNWDYASAFVCDIVHAIDLVRYIAQSEPKKIATIANSINSRVDNIWNSTILFENGISATLRANYQAAARIHDFEIHGPGASAFVNMGFGEQACEATILYGNGTVIYSSASTGVGGDRKREDLSGPEIAGSNNYYTYYGYKQEDIEFIEAVLTGTQPRCNIEDAAKTMDMVEMMLENQI